MARSADLKNPIASLMIRIPLGIIMMAHGSQKLMGIFGGSGLTETLRSFEEKLHIPPIFTLLVIIAEFAGGFGILTGFLTRLSATGVAIVMIVAIYKSHWMNGFFLSSQPGHGSGVEYAFALLGMAIYLMIVGGGQWCLDRLIFRP